jgi:uridine phosphorylase
MNQKDHRMPKHLSDADLILSDDQRIYHLNLHPDDVADNVILVGDPERVKMIGKYFDRITARAKTREFSSLSGMIGATPMTVLSTGISTANIDIVMNELDALVNIDFKTRQAKPTHRQLNIIRLGTAGSIQADIPLDSTVVSSYGLSLGSLLHFYKLTRTPDEKALINDFSDHLNLNKQGLFPTAAAANADLLKTFQADCIAGITLTCPGFYAPQGRHLRLAPSFSHWIEDVSAFRFKGQYIANFEMETAAIYRLGQLLGHRCASLSAIVADRVHNRFSKRPNHTIKQLIRTVLDTLCD